MFGEQRKILTRFKLFDKINKKLIKGVLKMCEYKFKYFMCKDSSFLINQETGGKIPFCRFYQNGKCLKKCK